MAQPMLRPLLVSIFLLWLSGCTVLQQQRPVEAPLNMSEREQQLTAMRQFSLQASVGVKSPAESISGNLRWQQKNNTEYHARLSNFLGISLFELTQDSSGSEIQIKGESYRAADTSTLLLQLSGWSRGSNDEAKSYKHAHFKLTPCRILSASCKKTMEQLSRYHECGNGL